MAILTNICRENILTIDEHLRREYQQKLKYEKMMMKRQHEEQLKTIRQMTSQSAQADIDLANTKQQAEVTPQKLLLLLGV